jgi:hypothetical protein
VPASSSRPAPVLVAVVALAALVALQIYLTVSFARAGAAGWAMYAAAAALWALLVAGLWRRSRLAWLWGRYLTLVLGVAVAARLTLGVVRGEVARPVLVAAALGLCFPLFTAGVALGRRSVLAWYDLVCPACGTPTSLGADFFFRQARCRRCGARW